ncbi:uncharacterized protein J8A68_006105 [[Candida] subhashii]|uniref:non-specific serine/threonine protein kinase n=1 Tax=[Candida] subhashii TaxID=561895 RepID=A0A8J5QB33_9ASCO|nr:uncharacterized protein J8A68_006105 [[Candida] subhashii]KAG7660387.1 hypothetical protein J8A68_006105 [[Candida] subhashii]
MSSSLMSQHQPTQMAAHITTPSPPLDTNHETKNFTTTIASSSTSGNNNGNSNLTVNMKKNSLHGPISPIQNTPNDINNATTASSLNTTASNSRNSFLLKQPSNGTTTTSISISDPIYSTHEPQDNTNKLPDHHRRDSSLSISPTVSPTQKPTEDFRHNIFSKVTGVFSNSKSTSRSNSRQNSLQNSRQNSRQNSMTSLREQLGQYQQRNNSTDLDKVSEMLSPRTLGNQSTGGTSAAFPYSSHLNYGSTSGFFPYKSYHSSPVKETNRVLLEYDPISRRKVLNTYEILREIGRGEHGKVKLAKDLITNEFVAIKIVNRKSKKDRPSLRIRKNSLSNNNSQLYNEYEMKIKREIAIMKKCRHKHIVTLKEVLDDLSSYKIYLVLEYLEKGEIKWKRLPNEPKQTIEQINSSEIPCCGSQKQQQQQSADSQSSYRRTHRPSTHITERDLLSNEYSPNLTFKQSRSVFRDIVLGLEYLHLQGIVHRDIKPANLLVSSENIVKISDFGVSFASSLSENEEGHLVNELDLAKTAGTPAFFAPELCRECNPDKTCKIDYKIDIWALGVTLYCLLFGKVPFNADSEYELFKVIVNQPLEFPETKDSFNSPANVTEEEFELAKDLLSKLLDKNSRTRIEIKDIKEHPFTLMDLEDDLEKLNELFTMNQEDNINLDFDLEDHDIVSKEEIDNAIIGIGTRIKRSLVRAIRAGGWKDSDVRSKFAALQLEHSKSGSSEDDSTTCSNFNSQSRVNVYNPGLHSHVHSMILSEGMPISAATPPPPNMHPSHPAYHSTNFPPWTHSSPSGIFRNGSHHTEHHNPHVPSALSHQAPTPISTSSGTTSSVSQMNSPYSYAGIREGAGSTNNNVGSRSFLHEMIESHSNSSSRRGSTSIISEAPQIETKRNVGGDLYLKNQCIVETFKGIQLQDDKRRRSSIFSLHSQNSSVNIKHHDSVGSNNNEEILSRKPSGVSMNNAHYLNHHHVHHGSIAAPIPVPASSIKTSIPSSSGTSTNVGNPTTSFLNNNDGNTSNNNNTNGRYQFGQYLNNNGTQSSGSSRPSLKVGPISIRPATIQPNNEISGEEMVDIHNHNGRDSVMSLPLSESFASLDSINDDYLSMKYQEFTNRKLNSQSEQPPQQQPSGQPTATATTARKLRRKSSLSETFLDQMGNNQLQKINQKFKDFNLSNSMKKNDSANSEPTQDSTNRDPLSRYTSRDSYSSYSTCSSSDTDEDSDEEEQNLTLAFTSKVAPLARPMFNLSKRAKSHESNLPRLGANGGVISKNPAGTTIVFHDGLPEFEDLPMDLMKAAGGGSISLGSGQPNIDLNPTISVIASNGSLSTLTGEIQNSIDDQLAQSENPAPASTPIDSQQMVAMNNQEKVIKRKPKRMGLRENIFNNQFNNHYKKDPIYSPFPISKHLDNDKESIAKKNSALDDSDDEIRPNTYRSNSVTVALLQHQKVDLQELIENEDKHEEQDPKAIENNKNE